MTNITKILMLISTVVLMIGGGFSFYFTYKSYQPIPLISENGTGIALDGFDAVAYHTEGIARQGEQRFQVKWSDCLWYFSSLENSLAFSGSPEDYAPQFGGYDAYAMAVNGSAQAATPELWTIVEEKLYLFHSGETRRLWREKQSEHIHNANSQWAKLTKQFHYKNETGN